MAQYSRSSRFNAVSSHTVDPDQSANPAPGHLPISHEQAYNQTAERRHAINRRHGVLWAFLYGNFRPRRRLSRRAADNHLFMFDWHEPHILYLALGVLLLSCTDALFTLNLLSAGATEGNAVMASMLDDSVDNFLAVKIGITSLSLVVLVAAARRKFFRSFSVGHLLQVLCVGYFLVICYEVFLLTYVFELALL